MLESRIRVPLDTAPEYFSMRCRSCDSDRVRLVIDLGEQPLCNRLIKADVPIGAEPVYPLRLGYCEHCTLLQIDHTIPRDDMFRDYVYVSGTTDTLRRHFAETTERLAAAYNIVENDFVVDIGSNDGTWLKTWQPYTSKVCGVDPATEIAERAKADGIYTFNDYFDLRCAERLIRSQIRKPKLITSAGSFFHMEDLHGACEGVKRLLADDGVFICQAISARSMTDACAFDQVLHEHLCYYSLASFICLMKQHGLDVFDAGWHPIHGGTMEYHVCHAGRRHVERTADTDGPGWVTLKDAQRFARQVLRLRDELIATLALYRRRGKSVWAYGAPGKGATLLNSFGIGPDLVRCAVEKNPLKFGLSIPGCRIPIIAEGTAHPDAYLVLAWNFLPEFIEKERAFLEGGGEFIVPIPELRVVGKEALSEAA